MIPNLTELMSQLETGVLAIQPIFEQCDCDELLDHRDSSPTFDAMYATAFAKTAGLRSDLSLDPTKRLRYQAFAFVAVVTGNHEIASYVSDDFALIGWAAYNSATQTCDTQIRSIAEWLYDEYSAGRFPIPSNWDDNRWIAHG